jgi:hypothetical protein
MTGKTGGGGYSLLLGQMAAIKPRTSPFVLKRSRGRPRKQEPVVILFLRRLREGATEQSWLRERNQIQRAWSGANPPHDRTIKRAIGPLYDRLRWVDGKVTAESAALVYDELIGQ